jgi:hypothetical protein
MRVWLIEADRCEGTQTSLEPALRALAQQSTTGFTLVGVSNIRPDLAPLLRTGLLSALIINVSHWDPQASQTELLSLGLPILLAGDAKTADSWTGLAGQHTVGFLPAAADSQGVYCALWSLLAGQRREQELRTQSERLQQRLNDRIIIEKAKGILMQRLSVPEEEAYQRLRMQSRRQRKQIREIAQSILDTEMLLDTNSSERGSGIGAGAAEGAKGTFPEPPPVEAQHEKLGGLSRS